MSGNTAINGFTPRHRAGTVASNDFLFTFRDVGLGTGECPVRLVTQPDGRCAAILNESGRTRLGTVEHAFTLIATQLYRRQLAWSRNDPEEISWFYQSGDSMREIELEWDGERFGRKRAAERDSSTALN